MLHYIYIIYVSLILLLTISEAKIAIYLCKFRSCTNIHIDSIMSTHIYIYNTRHSVVYEMN